MPHRAIHWFQRDLRVADNPALHEAVSAGSQDVLPLFVIDPQTWGHRAEVQKVYLLRSLAALNTSLEGNLTVRCGDPRIVIRHVAQEISAQSVHLAASYTPLTISREHDVLAALADDGVAAEVVGSPYAIAPGRVCKDDDNPYRVFTPFYRSWLAHGWRAPVSAPRDATWISIPSDHLPSTPIIDVELPPAGEQAAKERWNTFRKLTLGDYAQARDRTDLDGTSRMSVYLRFGQVHPRTLLADLGQDKSHEIFRKELAWREFYADVLFHQPGSADQYLRRAFADMSYDKGKRADHRLSEWQQGRTGYPMVDAAMRQLLQTGWMHNRARMIVASFLVKDLHLEWQQGAKWFMRHLVDGDEASNAHGWQWTAGSGTDAAPYFRVFNPVTQGMKFDPEGNYVREFIPELRHLAGKVAHEPWRSAEGYTHGYVERIVDHAAERTKSLERYEAIKGR